MSRSKHVLLSFSAVFICVSAAATNTISLSGEWRFALDSTDAGIENSWFANELPERIQLPGVLQARGFGNEISVDTPWVLSLYDRNWFLRADYLAYTNAGSVKVPFVCQPPRHYLGAAWYQRDVEISSDWEGRRVVLFLERPRWETRVWLDDKLIGSENSLCAPHEHVLGVVSPGKHRITIRVDNRMLMDYRPDAHSVSDSLGSSWNGITGAIELRSTGPVWIAVLELYPHVATRSVMVKGGIGNISGQSGSGKLNLTVTAANASSSKTEPVARRSEDISWTSEGGDFETEVPLGPEAALWDEFAPTLYYLTAQVDGGDAVVTPFGVSEFKARGRDFVINGRPTYLRGTHHGGDFPLTGFPPSDVAYWLKVFRTCKEWGLNHVRFHSYCPNEAAFEAADRVGIYLQIEPGMWNVISPGTPMEKMLNEETERIIRAYGNHPSFVLLSAGNEPKGRWQQALPAWADRFRQRDPRRLYVTGTGHTERELPNPTEGTDALVVQRIGPKMLRRESAWFGDDYEDSLEGIDIPVASHELGQWCAYPDFDVIKKFTGYARPGNYEIFRESAEANGVLEMNHEYAYASGRFQFACYKEELEANLRTRGMNGFQLLDLHDYTGQGTALVGLLDPFWEEKSYARPYEWRGFCNSTVPLARLRERVFTTADRFHVPVEVVHYGATALENAVLTAQVLSARGKVVYEGRWLPQTLRVGTNFAFGNIEMDLSRLAAPAAYKLVLSLTHATKPAGSDRPVIETFKNNWNFWLYPGQVSDAAPADVLVTRAWPEAEERLAAGGKVLFLPRMADLDWSSPPLDRVPVFWNRLMNPQWGRMLGLWCDTKHPALAGFPTESNCDWQWTQITRGMRAVNVGKLPSELKPIVVAVDDWNRNWKLAPIFECRVGQGSLLVCSFDITSRLNQRTVARQLRRSLLDYAGSSRFRPSTVVASDAIRSLWFDSLVMRHLGTTATASSGNAGAMIDGDPNTYWSAGGGRGDGGRYPYEVTITMPNPVTMKGVILMNRQNDRNHLGDIREFTLSVSDDGQAWREVASGELASTWNPQTLAFGEPVTAKQLKLTARSGFGNDNSAALAELAVLPEGTVSGGGGEINYQRVRSTSGDVDEGTEPPNGP